MSSRLPNQPTPIDDEFVARLAEYDEQLAAGNAPPTASSLPTDEMDQQLAQRLSRAQSFLRILKQAWPRGSSLDGGQPTSRDSDLDDLPATAAIGGHIGRFELIRELGRGGFGVVFLAVDPVLGRQVALKVPRPEVLVSPDLRRRFLREAQAAAVLDHPHLVHVYEAGEVGPICYIASALCHGRTLDDWINERKEPVPPKTAARLVSMLADAVQHAHSRGILHRDLKPSNVLLDADVESGSTAELGFTPKLTDFGLAKLLERDPADKSTPASSLIGTPSYMAPEQAEGKDAEVGPAADVYSLGAILYDLLVGHPPFRGESDRETLTRLLTEEPQHPRKVRPMLSRDLEAICLKCLEKQPSNRYESAAALSADLHRFLTGVPTRARPLGLGPRLAKWGRRRPTAAALWGVCIVAAVSLPLVYGWQQTRMEMVVVQAQQGRAAVERRGRDLERRYYAVGIKLAQAAYSNADVHQAIELLDEMRPPPGREDIRGFAWHYLWRLCHGDPVTLKGHADEVCFLTFSTDGHVLGSAGNDGTIKLWKMPEGELRTTMVADSGRVHAIAFSPDGMTLASCSSDRSVRIWDTQTGSPRFALLENVPEVRCLAFSGDGMILAVAGDSKLVELFDTTTWKKQGELAGHADGIQNLAWTTDGKWLAAGGADHVVNIWNLADSREPFYHFSHDDVVSSVTFAHDGLTLASSGLDHVVKLWDMTVGKLRASLHGHDSEVSYVEFSRDDRWLASVSKRGTVRLWDAKTGELLHVVQGHTDRAWCAAFSPIEDLLATAGADHTIKLWDLNSWRTAFLLSSLPTGVESLSFSNDGQTLGCGDLEGSIHLFDVSTGARRKTVHEHSQSVVDLRWSPDGKLLASASLDGTVRLWDPVSGEVRWTLSDHAGGALCASFSADGELLATGGADGRVRLWDPVLGQLRFLLKRFTGRVNALAFSHQGRLLAVGHDRGVTVFDLSKHEPAILLVHPDVQVNCLIWSRQNAILAAGDAEGRAFVWSSNLADSPKVLVGGQTDIRDLAFGPLGRTLVSTSTDGSIKVWNIPTEQVLISLEGHEGPVTAATFSPDGCTLATGGRGKLDQGQVYLWIAAEPE